MGEGDEGMSHPFYNVKRAFPKLGEIAWRQQSYAKRHPDIAPNPKKAQFVWLWDFSYRAYRFKAMQRRPKRHA